MQLFLLSLCALCLGSVMSAAIDFDELRQDYEFIYHDRQNLLLVVHQDVCYFAYMPDSNEDWTSSSSRRRTAERVIIEFIEGHNPFRGLEGTEPEDVDESSVRIVRRDGDSAPVTVRLSQSSLGQMRDKFEDMLADAHCNDKAVYEARMARDFWAPDIEDK